MKMTCINVGYGDSLLLEWKDSVMLIDGGSALESEFEGFPARIRSADYLQKTGIGRIDTLVITHIHEDHVCGLTALFDKADIKQVYIPFPPELFKDRSIPDAEKNAPENVRLFARSLKDFTKIMETCRVREIPVKEICAGDVLNCAGGARLFVWDRTKKTKKPFYPACGIFSAHLKKNGKRFCFRIWIPFPILQACCLNFRMRTCTCSCAPTIVLRIGTKRFFRSLKM